jgi:hypothetical protein
MYRSGIKNLMKKEMTRKDFLSVTGLALISLFGVAGVLAEIISKAESPYTSSQASSGTLTGTAKVVTATGAVTGSAVEFEAPVATTNPVPVAPASLGVSGYPLIFSDEFNTGSLNTKIWVPQWFSSTMNGTDMLSENVSVGANGLNLPLTQSSTSGLIHSCPASVKNGGASTGFQFLPADGRPVFVEWYVYSPAAPNGEVANWCAVWSDAGAVDWPIGGEIDTMESYRGYYASHEQWGPSDNDNVTGGDLGVLNISTTPGWHTWGVLWSTTGLTMVYDGNVSWTHAFAAGAETEAMTTYPHFLIANNSLQISGGSPASTLGVTMNVRYVRVWQAA